jgi:predicted double-glycine peptidase
VLWCLAVASLVAVPVARAGDAEDGRGRVLGVKSVHELRWENVVRQRIEVGCAAASLATILTYYFGFPTTEQEMADAMHAEAIAMNQGELTKHIGFSMPHIVRVAEKGGLIARGFRVPIEHLDRIKIPVIARVSIRGRDHFLVFKGAQNGRIFVADPAFGNGSYRLAAFEKIWSGLMIGFIRSGENPQGHELLITERDQLGEEWFRVAQRNHRSVRDLAGPNMVTVNISLLPPQLERLVPGLDPAFPNLVGTRIRF